MPKYSESLIPTVTLNNSDHLGAPGTLYPTGVDLCGMVGTIEGTDFVEVVNPVVGPPQSVRVNSNVEFVLDGVRIITRAAVIPEPTTLFLAIAAAAIFATCRR